MRTGGLTALRFAVTLVSMFVLPAVILLAQTPAPPVDPPRLDLEPKIRVNLGEVGPREVRQQVYTVTNVSKAPLRLRILDLSPGVTLAGPALEGPLGPGQAATMTLRVDPTDFVGWQVRNVRLATDDPRQGLYYLPVAMTVRPDLTVDPDRASFGAVRPHESPERVFRFRRETGLPTRLRFATPPPPYLEAELADLPASQDGKPTEGELRLILRAGSLPPGQMAGLETLHLETGAPLQPHLRITVDWRLELPVKVDPPRLVLLSSREAAGTVRLASRDGSVLRLDRAWIEGPGFRLDPPPGPGPEVVLRVVREAGAEASALLCVQLAGEPLPLRIPLLYRPELSGAK